MFQPVRRTSTWSLVFNFAEVTYHSTVRKVRQKHGNAFLSIVMSVMQSLLFVAAFWLLFNVLGTRTVAIRGDFMLYLLSGIFLYLVHVQSVTGVMGAETSTSPMMQHAPMNTLVAIISSALSVLYIKMISLLVILFIMHTLMQPVVIYDWAGCLMMFLLAWGSGCVIGVAFLALKPWMPDIVSLMQLIYVRANMIASGKMFVANMLPSMMIAMFDWNPLFHIIDQMRGFAFGNYFPHYSNWQYPFYFTLILLVLAMMGEFYTRKHASASWSMRR